MKNWLMNLVMATSLTLSFQALAQEDEGGDDMSRREQVKEHMQEKREQLREYVEEHPERREEAKERWQEKKQNMKEKVRSHKNKN